VNGRAAARSGEWAQHFQMLFVSISETSKSFHRQILIVYSTTV